MATKTRQPKEFGDALLSSPGGGWHFETRGVGVRFSFDDVKAYCQEHAATYGFNPWRIYVDHRVFSEPGVNRGDWLTWSPDRPDELIHEHERIPKTLNEALAVWGQDQTEANFQAVKGFLSCHAAPVAFSLKREGPVHEYVVWVPEKQQLQHHVCRSLDLADCCG